MQPPPVDLDSPAFHAAELVAKAKTFERRASARRFWHRVQIAMWGLVGLCLLSAYPAAMLYDRQISPAVTAELPPERNWRLEQSGLARTIVFDIVQNEGWRPEAPLWSPRAQNRSAREFQIETLTGLSELTSLWARVYPSNRTETERDVVSATRLLTTTVTTVRGVWPLPAPPPESLSLASMRAAEAALTAFDNRIARQWAGRALPPEGLTGALELIARWMRRSARDLERVAGQPVDAGPALARARALAALSARLMAALSVDYRYLLERTARTDTIASLTEALQAIHRDRPLLDLNLPDNSPLGSSHAAALGFRALSLAERLENLARALSSPSP